MDQNEIKEHWRNWAKTYSTSLRATTKTATAKAMELEALTRRFRRIQESGATINSVLEVGCGNGENVLHLATTFPQLRFTGIDIVPEMIEAAVTRRDEAGLTEDRLRLTEGNALSLPAELDASYDVIFTDRCLINLNTDELQCQALKGLCDRLPEDGYLIMIENNTTTYGQQNRAREMVGLPPRTPASFNHFFDEAVILPHLEQACGMEVLDIEDFISLHDLVLYVLVPALTGGDVDYEHPLVEIATTLNMKVSEEQPSAFGSFGQNRLYVARKKT